MMTFLRNLFVEDLWLKLFSLALAILTWLTVTVAIQKGVSPAAASGPMKDVMYFNVPVTVLSAGADVRAFRVDPKEVQLTVRGDPRLLSTLSMRDIRVMVDLTGAERASELRKRVEVATPAGVTHVRVEPQEVLVIFPAKL
jgi:YbbR domain-containing protein